MKEKQLVKKLHDLLNREKITEAEKVLASLSDTQKRSHHYHFYSGKVFLLKGRCTQAISLLKEAHRLNPQELQIHHALGTAYTKSKQYSDAMTWFKKILSVKPNDIPTLLMISAIFDVTGNPVAAERTCNMILSLDKKNGAAYNNLANAYVNSGRATEAIAPYLKAIEYSPNLATARSNLLLALNYVALNGRQLRKDHENFTQDWHKPRYSHVITSLKGRKLRIGLVSPDFCTHSVAYFLLGLFNHLDRTKFFLSCYSSVKHPDNLTSWFRDNCDLWRDIQSNSPEETQRLIHTDKIDILIDLAGHSGENSLEIFGYQPAPVQITWLGYPATTGMPSINYRLTDSQADPENFDHHYTETLYRLPCFLNYTSISDLPDCDFSKSLNRDYLLFGSFNNIAKLCPITIELWATILSHIPQSKLLIKHKHFNDPGVQDIFLDNFKSFDIAEDQLIFHPFNFSLKDHLQQYHEIDIALDTFPYNGTTTTFEAMVMGVPTLTLSGAVHAARVGTAIMNGVGLSDFVAKTPEQLIKRAVYYSENRDELLEIKKGMRDRFMKSPFNDQVNFTKSFEKALIEIWDRSSTIAEQV